MICKTFDAIQELKKKEKCIAHICFQVLRVIFLISIHDFAVIAPASL